MLSILFYIYLAITTLLHLVLLTLAWLLTVWWDKKRTAIHVVSNMWTHSYFLFLPRKQLRREGFENVDRKKEYVIVVNHRSMFDIIPLYELPLQFRWVSKREVYKIPIFGWVVYVHGDIMIDRGSAGAAKKLNREGKQWLDRGVSVMVFPEGTRNKGEGVSRFKEGAFAMAKHAEVAILPCVMTGTDTVMNGWRLNFKNIYVIKALPPIGVEQVAKHSSRELADMAHDMISKEYEQLKRLNE